MLFILNRIPWDCGRGQRCKVVQQYNSHSLISLNTICCLSVPEHQRLRVNSFFFWTMPTIPTDKVILHFLSISLIMEQTKTWQEYIFYVSIRDIASSTYLYFSYTCQYKYWILWLLGSRHLKNLYPFMETDRCIIFVLNFELYSHYQWSHYSLVLLCSLFSLFDTIEKCSLLHLKKKKSCFQMYQY